MLHFAIGFKIENQCFCVHWIEKKLILFIVWKI